MRFLKSYFVLIVLYLVYWRPPNPPTLPDYIIKEFSTTSFAANFLKPDPTLKVSFIGIEGSLRFLKFPSNRSPEFIEFVKGIKKEYQ